MPTAIALHWNEKSLHYAVAQDGQIEAASSIPLEPNMSPEAIGQRLAESLAPYSSGRAKTIVALSRSKLQWQHLSLPPCPAEELPALVQLQAERDFNSNEDDLGFDFLPLAGDEQTPHEVLTVAVDAGELASIRQVCQAADLALERLVPLTTGWPALVNQASPGTKLGTQIYVALTATEATLWAIRIGQVVLLRQFQLAASNEPATIASAVGSELRRTLLALSQHANNGPPAISLVGNQHLQLAELSKLLKEKLKVSVQPLDVTTQHPGLDIKGSSPPLAGLAADESLGHRPLVDLLHPRRRPQANINVRTYALAGTAGILLLALVSWLGYTNLQAPLNQAATDQAELTLLEKPLDSLKNFEQRAETIRNWNAEVPNLLLHLEQVSRLIRPKTLDSENFADEHDVVLEKLSLEKRQLTFDALARNNRAVQPLEARLRKANYRSQRGKSDPSTSVPKYPWHFKSTIEITSASDNFDNATSTTPKPPQDEEPQS